MYSRMHFESKYYIYNYFYFSLPLPLSLCVHFTLSVL